MRPRALLLAGWGTDPSRLRHLRERVAGIGVDARTWDYRATGTLETLAAGLRRAVASAGAPVHLVGHSLGGLVAARATVDSPDDAGIATVTTINAPWRGTWLGWTGSSELAVQLRWGSAALSDLRDRFADHVADRRTARWLLIGCLGDLATPPTTSLRPGADGPPVTRRLLGLAGHSSSLAAPALAEAVTAHLRDGHGRGRPRGGEPGTAP